MCARTKSPNGSKCNRNGHDVRNKCGQGEQATAEESDPGNEIYVYFDLNSIFQAPRRMPW